MKSTWKIVTQHALCRSDCWFAAFLECAHTHTNTHYFWQSGTSYLCFLSFSPVCNSLPVLHHSASTISRQKDGSLHVMKCNAHVEKNKWGWGALSITSNHATVSMVFCLTADATVLSRVFAIAKWSFCLTWSLDFRLPANLTRQGGHFFFFQSCCKYCVHASQS